MEYRFLEHTADIMFEAFGKSYPEALQHAAKALFSISGPAAKKEKVQFQLSAHNVEELTVAALADLLSYMDTHEIVFSEIKVDSFDSSKNFVSFHAFGEKKRPRDHVKAVTYHEMMVKKDADGWTIRVLLDV